VRELAELQYQVQLAALGRADNISWDTWVFESLELGLGWALDCMIAGMEDWSYMRGKG
jgi:hypothetical protein